MEREKKITDDKYIDEVTSNLDYEKRKKVIYINNILRECSSDVFLDMIVEERISAKILKIIPLDFDEMMEKTFSEANTILIKRYIKLMKSKKSSPKLIKYRYKQKINRLNISFIDYLNFKTFEI